MTEIFLYLRPDSFLPRSATTGRKQGEKIGPAPEKEEEQTLVLYETICRAAAKNERDNKAAPRHVFAHVSDTFRTPHTHRDRDSALVNPHS